MGPDIRKMAFVIKWEGALWEKGEMGKLGEMPSGLNRKWAKMKLSETVIGQDRYWAKWKKRQSLKGRKKNGQNGKILAKWEWAKWDWANWE